MVDTKIQRESLTYEEAEKLCDEFARKHDIQFRRYGTCGFGRHCSGFSRDGTWVAYHPRKASYPHFQALNPDRWDKVEEFNKARLDAPEGVEAYHKDDYLCVLHGAGCIDDKEFAKMFGTAETPDAIIEVPDHEKPRTPQMEEAVIQLARWVLHMEEVAAFRNSELFVGTFNNGYRGMQAMLSGTMNPAIGVR